MSYPICDTTRMAKSKSKKRRKRPDHQAPSAVLLAARLRSGAGKHDSRPTRTIERKRAIQDAS